MGSWLARMSQVALGRYMYGRPGSSWMVSALLVFVRAEIGSCLLVALLKALPPEETFIESWNSESEPPLETFAGDEMQRLLS
jgi:hypothetical protein